jgi:hypothetical protein
MPSPSSDPLTLTPLGPGGRPFTRWRPLAVLLALAVLGVATIVLLSDRAPGVIESVSERVDAQLEERAPEARRAARDAVAGTRAEESDVLAHIGLWAAATVLVGLATWSWPSLAVAVVLLVGGSTALELVQEELAPTRITERSDLVANAAGIALGVALVIAVNAASGLPARIRRLRESQDSTGD